MPDPLTLGLIASSLPGVIQGGANVIGALRGDPLEKHLKRIRRRGAFTPAQERMLLNRVGATTGAVAGTNLAATRGRLAAKGLSGSIAGQRLLAQPGLQRQRQLGQAQQGIALSEATAQSNAASQLAGVRSQNRGQLAQGLGQIAQGVGGAFVQRQQQQFEGQMLAIMQGAGSTDDKRQRLLNLLQQYGYTSGGA